MSKKDNSLSVNTIRLELLAPAKNVAIGMLAVDHGADAVYIGAPGFGARHQASNSIEDIALLCRNAHRFGARVYVTMNTIVYEHETGRVEKMVWELYAAGVDALIVQDMAYLEMNLPPIQLHASTQCDIRTPEKAKFLQDAGFSQLVLPREMSLAEIKSVAQAVTVPLEAFVHGALCVSYSGDCQASYVLTKRSANRGECSQICRYAFDLVDAEGRIIMKDKHLLSLHDMNRIDAIEELVKAGVRSFKIEGRLKESSYVKNVVAAYSDVLNKLVEESNGRYGRSSNGRVVRTFTPDLMESFNRGYTSYFLRDTAPERLAQMTTPKWMGREVGRVIRQLNSRVLKINSTIELHNGDGLGYVDPEGRFCGFRVNRVDTQQHILHTAIDVAIKPGTVLYRNSNKAWEDNMARHTAGRNLMVKASLRKVPFGVALTLEIPDSGNRVEVCSECSIEPSRSPQKNRRIAEIAKLGQTIFELMDFEDTVGDMEFVPASVVSSLRRMAVAMLEHQIEATYQFPQRAERATDLRGYRLDVDRQENVANSLSERFYNSCGVDVMQRALEVEDAGVAAQEGELRVMQTRYCLRRELGACLKGPNAHRLPRELFLRANGFQLRIECDCQACRMNLYVSQSGR